MIATGNLHRMAMRPAVSSLLLRSMSGSVNATAPSEAVRPFDEMPGPPSLPLIGTRWSYLFTPWNTLNLKDSSLQLKTLYGKIVRVSKGMSGKDGVMLYDAADIEKVYRSEGLYPRTIPLDSIAYFRRILRKEAFEGAYGLLSVNGKEWQDFRRRVQPHMLQPRTVAKYTAPVDVVAAEFIDRLREIRDKDGMLPENAVNWFFRWSLESIATIALDTRLGCLDSDVAGEPQQMIDAVQVVFEGMFELDVKPSLWRYISTPTWRKYVKMLDLFIEVSQRYTEQTMERLKKKVAEGVTLDGDLSVMEKLLLANDNPRIATTMASDMITAGIDTTSYATAALLYLLSRNPDKQEELYAELHRILPEKDTPVTSERLAEMKYLRAAIKESMRMLPVTLGQTREISVDNLVLGNYAIPKGTFVVMVTSITALDPEYFPDPERFLPERWLKGSEGHRKAHPFAALPFGFGARMCIGMRFAELEIEVLSAKILRNFRVEYPGEAKFASRILYVMKSPLTFRLIDRD